MDSGAYDRRVTIRRRVAGDDGFSSGVGAFEDLVDRRAWKRDLSDGERFQAGEQSAGVTTRFRFRFDEVTSTITPKDQIVHDGRVYEIVGVKELGRKEGIEVTTAVAIDEDPE